MKNGIFGYNNSGGAYWIGHQQLLNRNDCDSTARLNNVYTSRAVIINGEGI